MENLHDKYIALLKASVTGDEENDHYRQDCLLCELLNELGYSDVVNEWEKPDKWYA